MKLLLINIKINLILILFIQVLDKCNLERHLMM